MMFGEILEVCLMLGEGRLKGVQSVLSIYRDLEKGLDPREDQLDEALMMFLEHISEYVKYWRENPNEVDFFASSKEELEKTKNRFFNVEKEMESALKQTASSGEKIIALDRVVDLMHNDLYVLDHFMTNVPSASREQKKIDGITKEIISLLRKLGRVEGPTSADSPEFMEEWGTKRKVAMKRIAAQQAEKEK